MLLLLRFTRVPLCTFSRCCLHPLTRVFPAQVPPKYEYSYDVNDDYQKLNFEKTESRDGYKTAGSYSVQLPDGRKQTVTYNDNGDGLEAEVTYEGDILVEAYPAHPHPAPSYPSLPYFPPYQPPVYHPIPTYSSHPAPAPTAAAAQAAPEAAVSLEAASAESSEESSEGAAPAKIVEEPAPSPAQAEVVVAPAEDAEGEASSEEAQSSPLVEEAESISLEEEVEDAAEDAEDTTVPPEE